MAQPNKALELTKHGSIAGGRTLPSVGSRAIITKSCFAAQRQRSAASRRVEVQPRSDFWTPRASVLDSSRSLKLGFGWVNQRVHGPSRSVGAGVTVHQAGRLRRRRYWVAPPPLTPNGVGAGARTAFQRGLVPHFRVRD